MHLLRYAIPSGEVEVGVIDELGVVPLPVGSMADLLARPVAEIERLARTAAGQDSRRSADQVRPLPPIDGRMEVWGAGVTYEQSRDARVEESDGREIYWKVYEADRPELFLKATPWRVVTGVEPSILRADSPSSVAEPELAVLTNAAGEIVGATICDDLTSRSIEAANPLYLSQAKIFTGSCVVAPAIRPWWEIKAPLELAITMRISHGDQVRFESATSTGRLHRSYESLVSWLYRELDFPDGAILSTGTGIVPPLDNSLADGDLIEITVDDVGTLRHQVRARS